MEQRFTPAKLAVVACSIVLVAGYVWWRSGGREEMRVFSSSKSARMSRMQVAPPSSPPAEDEISGTWSAVDSGSLPPELQKRKGSNNPDPPTGSPALMKSSKSAAVLDPRDAVFNIERSRTISMNETEGPTTPPRALMAHACSNNHDGQGQNIVYTDAHVEWFESPFASTQPSTQPVLLPDDNKVNPDSHHAP